MALRSVRYTREWPFKNVTPTDNKTIRSFNTESIPEDVILTGVGKARLYHKKPSLAVEAIVPEAIYLLQ
jgi:hypothetical protein